MMIDILVFFIGASLLLYVLLGGSDYGAAFSSCCRRGSCARSRST